MFNDLKMSLRLGLIIMLLAISIVACQTPFTTEATPPCSVTIKDFTVSSKRVKVNESIQVSINIDNPDGLGVQYTWSTSEGNYSKLDQPITIYTAPNYIGEQDIIVKISPINCPIIEKKEKIVVVATDTPSPTTTLPQNITTVTNTPISVTTSPIPTISTDTPIPPTPTSTTNTPPTFTITIQGIPDDSLAPNQPVQGYISAYSSNCQPITYNWDVPNDATKVTILANNSMVNFNSPIIPGSYTLTASATCGGEIATATKEIIVVATPTPTHTPIPTNTPTPTPTNTPTPITAVPTKTQPITTVPTPTVFNTPTVTSTPTNSLLLFPPSLINPEVNQNLTGDTTFTWEWNGANLPDGYAFEVQIKHPQDNKVCGLHDAKEKSLINPNNQYQHTITKNELQDNLCIKTHGNSADYQWTVAIVKINDYKDIGIKPEFQAIQINVIDNGQKPKEPNSGGGGGGFN